jgi:hypothetical protein
VKEGVPSRRKGSTLAGFAADVAAQLACRRLTFVPDLAVAPADLAVAALDEVPDRDAEADLLQDLVGVLAVQVQGDGLVRLDRELVRQDRDRILAGSKGRVQAFPISDGTARGA